MTLSGSLNSGVSTLRVNFVTEAALFGLTDSDVRRELFAVAVLLPAGLFDRTRLGWVPVPLNVHVRRLDRFIVGTLGACTMSESYPCSDSVFLDLAFLLAGRLEDFLL